MKLKLKTIILFCISFLFIIYPVFNFTNNKIKTFNLNEDLEIFNINTFVKLEAFNTKSKEINAHLKNINNFFFKGMEVITLSNAVPKEIFISGTNLLKEVEDEQNRITYRVFYLPLVSQTLFIPFTKLDFLFQENDNLNCKKIKTIDATLDKIDKGDFILTSRIMQSQLETTKDLKTFFANCLPESLKKYIKVYIDELSYYNEIKKQDNLDSLEYFIKLNESLFLNEDIKEKFRIEIGKIDEIFFNNLSENIFKYYFNQPFDYKTKTVYKKNFSPLNVSILMTLMLNILFFYILYFLRIRLKILNNIF